MLQLPLQRPQTMDRESRARDLITRAEKFRARKVRHAKRRLDFGGLGLGEQSESYGTTVHNLAIMDPSHEELSGKIAKELEDKYNFDFEEEKAKEGNYKWEAIEPDSEKASDIPDFYLRGPHKKKQLPSRIIGATDWARSDESLETSPELRENSPPPSAGSRSNSRVISTTATRQLFEDSAGTQGNTTLSSLDIAHSPTQNSPNPYSQEGMDCCTFGGANTHDILSIFTDSIRESADDLEQPVAVRNGVTNATQSSPTAVKSLQDSADLVMKDAQTSQNPSDLTPAPQVSIKKAEDSEAEEGGKQREETPCTSTGVVDGDRKRKQTQVTDFFQEKKKCIDRVKRKLYEDDGDNDN